MASTLNPYINFDGSARQALELYQSVFGGELRVNTFGENGMGEGPDAEKVMHGQLDAPGGLTIMAADTPQGMERTVGTNMSVSLSGSDGDELRRWWQGLSEGGTVTMALEKQMWGDEFGMCTDRYGVPWMVNIVAAQG